MFFISIAIIFIAFGIYDVFSENLDRKKIILKSILIFTVLLLGTRGFLGWDWYFYYPSFMEGTYIYEKGYMLYTSLIKQIFKSYIFYQFVTLTLDFIALYYIFKSYCKYKIMAFAIFFCIAGFHMEVELLRNMKAIILFLFSLKYIEERKIIPFLILNLIGFSFHTSAIFYLPMYYILNYNYRDRIVFLIFSIGSFYYLFQINGLQNFMNYDWSFLPYVLQNKILSYREVLTQNSFRGFNYFYFERAICFYLAFKYEKNRVLKNSLYLYIFIFLFTSELSIASFRVGILFIYSSWFVLARSIEKIKNKYLIVFLITFVSLSRISRSLLFPGNVINYRYQNVIFSELDYEKRSLELIKSKTYLKESYGKELLIQY
ncbi:MAG: EpsG family protein [Cetobacterium sp.]